MISQISEGDSRVEVRGRPLRGVSKASHSAVRLQRIIALGVMLVPFAGTVAALWLAVHQGVSRLDLTLFGAMYFATSVGVTVGYHRLFAHRAFRAGRRTQFVLAALGATAAQGPILFWAAVHRRHHAYSDGPGDPHSPNLHGNDWRGRVRGFVHSHVGWMLSDEVTSWPEYARDLMRDEFVVAQHERYTLWLIAGLVLPVLVGAAVTRSPMGALTAGLWGGLVRIFLASHASWCVGSVSHLYGSRPFATRDRSANNWLVAFFTFGEGLQNNHHAFPSSASHAVHWWEPDLSGLVIRAMKAAGLVWDVKLPTQRAILEARTHRRRKPA